MRNNHLHWLQVRWCGCGGPEHQEVSGNSPAEEPTVVKSASVSGLGGSLTEAIPTSMGKSGNLVVGGILLHSFSVSDSFLFVPQ